MDYPDAHLLRPSSFQKWELLLLSSSAAASYACTFASALQEEERLWDPLTQVR
jgi:hypothetical protein